MTAATTPRIGQFGLTRISGLTGLAVEAGQSLVGSRSRWTHAFVVVGGGKVVQAQPGGAVLVDLAEATAGREVVYSDLDLTDSERFSIAVHATSLVGTPYSFLDYAAIGAARLLHAVALERYVRDSGHMICSQLVDEAFRRAGVDLFPGRLAGDVTPGDLARLIGAR